ncbi:hypothetical protein AYI70_g8055 [Smittium culicis]|uniref:Uncharacterized protein n=1 Tax=Smittium culicis TaxID=133412 RepID=A0A1R1XHP8_9FUNG|nr:hypothetical protein AYI70_g8055 [Smittium culicis]
MSDIKPAKIKNRNDNSSSDDILVSGSVRKHKIANIDKSTKKASLSVDSSTYKVLKHSNNDVKPNIGPDPSQENSNATLKISKIRLKFSAQSSGEISTAVTATAAYHQPSKPRNLSIVTEESDLSDLSSDEGLGRSPGRSSSPESGPAVSRSRLNSRDSAKYHTFDSSSQLSSDLSDASDSGSGGSVQGRGTSERRVGKPVSADESGSSDFQAVKRRRSSGASSTKSGRNTGKNTSKPRKSTSKVVRRKSRFSDSDTGDSNNNNNNNNSGMDASSGSDLRVDSDSDSDVPRRNSAHQSRDKRGNKNSNSSSSTRKRQLKIASSPTTPKKPSIKSETRASKNTLTSSFSSSRPSASATDNNSNSRDKKVSLKSQPSKNKKTKPIPAPKTKTAASDIDDFYSDYPDSNAENNYPNSKQSKSVSSSSDKKKGSLDVEFDSDDIVLDNSNSDENGNKNKKSKKKKSKENQINPSIYFFISTLKKKYLFTNQLFFLKKIII